MCFKKRTNMNIERKLLTINEWSRPGKKLNEVKMIVVHWVANPDTTAEFNWRFFENKKNGETGYGSAHYIVNLNGDIIQAIPDDEMAYHVGSKNGPTPYVLKKFGNYPNNYSIGIELCHIDWEGTFADETFDSAVALCGFLCKKYDLDAFENILTHKFVIASKDCPRWFSEHPEDFDGFRSKVRRLI